MAQLAQFRIHIFIFAAVLFVTLYGQHADAADSKPITISTSVIAACKIQGVEDIRFGSLDPATATNITGEGQIIVGCTRGVEFRLSVDRGLRSADGGQRRMGGGGAYSLPYTLRADSFNAIGNGFANPTKLTIFATILGADYRDLPADNYLDVLRVILEY